MNLEQHRVRQAAKIVEPLLRTRSLGFGAPRLRKGRDDAARERGDEQRDRGDACDVPANEFPDPVDLRIRSREDRMSFQETLQVFAELLDGRVPLIGLLADGLEHDAIEITSEPTPQVRDT